MLAHGMLLALIACGGSGPELKSPGATEDICECVPAEPASSDYRFGAKHVPLPGGPPMVVTVKEILGWSTPPEPAADAPRTGRELQLHKINRGMLQLAWINPADCDIHLEVAESGDKNAPRVIVEVENPDEFCSARRQIESALAQRGFTLNKKSGELSSALPVEVVGLPFQDFNHKRGSNRVATAWEIHPAIVTVLPQ